MQHLKKTNFFICFIFTHSFFQINDLNQVPVPVMLLPDDFKANTKIKVNNHLFNKYLSKAHPYFTHIFIAQ